MACHLRVNSFTLGICLYIFPPHIVHIPHPFHFATPRFALRPISLTFSWGLVVQTTTRGRGWFLWAILWPVFVWFLLLRRTSAVPFVRITPVLVRLSWRRAIMDQISFFRKSNQWLRCCTFLLSPRMPIHLVCFPFHLFRNSVVCEIYTEKSVCTQSFASLLFDGIRSGLALRLGF